MNILAIESSSDACSVALLKDNLIDQLWELAPKKHGQLILPWVELLLSRGNLNLDLLDAIAFGSGPGSYTGLRIGVGVVQGLALAANLPVVPISSLRAIAQDVAEKYHEKNVLLCKDARMQELYWAGYQWNAETQIMELMIPESLMRASQINIPENNKWLAVGEGWTLYPELQSLCGDALPYLNDTIYPQAKTVAKIASVLFDDLKIKAEEALPTYLRQSESWKKIAQQ